MKLEMFQFLCLELKSRGGLADSKCIVVEEQVAMFLFTLAHASSNREVQERFQHSGETVSRHFHAVLQAINKLVSHYIKLPDPNITPTAITSDVRFYSFFNECIGALDGTHIAAKSLKQVLLHFAIAKVIYHRMFLPAVSLTICYSRMFLQELRVPLMMELYVEHHSRKAFTFLQ